jgi:PAS domain S-box-containing protein
MTTGISAPPEEWFAQHVDDLRRRVADARGRGSDQDVEVLVADLETAVEELRVAEEEVRVQGEEVTRLLKSRDLVRWRYERITAALPVSVVTTDRHGRLRTVNPSAAALFGVRIDHLLRKPLFVFLDDPDRHELRQSLTQARRGQTPRPCRVTLRTRLGLVEVVAYAGPATSREKEVSWLLLESDAASTSTGAGPGQRDLAAELPSALLALSDLSTHGAGLAAVMQRAAAVLAGALEPDAGIGICVGSPLAPRAVATTSPALQALDGWQIRTGEGPAVSAYDSGELVTAADVLTDDRWPSLRGLRETAAERVAACVSVPLITAEDGVSGVLNVSLSRELPVAGSVLVHVVETLGAAVASLVQDLEQRSAMQTLVDDMRAALTSRAVIDQAKGVVMADQHCTADEAFRHLVALSNNTHRKVRDVAQAIVEQVARA